MVAINNAMAQVSWTRNFLAAQCMYIPTTTIYQDNKSTILLTEKGRQKQSLNERYFLLWTKLKNERSSWYLHNAWHGMLADYFTKLLQGVFFCITLPSGTSMAVRISVLESRKHADTNNETQVMGGGENPEDLKRLKETGLKITREKWRKSLESREKCRKSLEYRLKKWADVL